jgi:hypothetical protein
MGYREEGAGLARWRKKKELGWGERERAHGRLGPGLEGFLLFRNCFENA